MKRQTNRTNSAFDEPRRHSRRSHFEEEPASIPARIKHWALLAWLFLFGLFTRAKELGGKRLAIAGLCLAVLIAVPIVVSALLGQDDSPNTVGANIPNVLYTPVPTLVGAALPADTPTPTPTPEPTPSPTPEPHPSNMVIRKGVEAPVVAQIQARLMELEYMESDEPTQYFGNITESSIMLFQRQHNLAMDGKVGMETFTLLMGDQATRYTVMLGADGTDVRELQIRLRELGYMDDVTGHFGEVTETAVKRFQELNKLTADGKVGSHTREALYSPNSKPNMIRYGENSPEIKEYQQKLKTLGYLTTTPDGNYGGDTKAAVSRFQELNGLIADGFLGYNTIKTLKSSGAKPNAVKLGMKGADVENIQKLLKKLGYTSAVTGYYGEITESAVKAFQKNNGLSQDGTVGRQTMNKLTSPDAKKATSGGGSAGGGSAGGGGGSGGSGGGSGGSSSGADKLISIAKSKLGSPYVYASKGPNSFDCSGFVYYCLNQSGVSVGYMTSSAWQSTNKFQRITSMSDIQKGDILSFRGHVGIYMGGGEMIDASSSTGKVRVTTNIKNSNYWTSHFVCAYRVF